MQFSKVVFEMIKFGVVLLATCAFAAAARWPSRIVGGVETTIEELPHQVGLLRNNGAWCGGSILNEQWVLTAAHCVHGRDYNDFSICSEATWGNCQDGKAHKIDNIIEHPSYDPSTLNNDWCLVKLADTINITNNPRAKAVQLLTVDPPKGLACTVSGWGALESGGDYPDRLMKVNVPIIDRQTCNDNQHYGGQITENMICAGFENGGKDACQGDSGGPLIFVQNGQIVQAGVVSWGEGCADEQKPGIYSSVPKAIPWIQQTIQYYRYSTLRTVAIDF